MVYVPPDVTPGELEVLQILWDQGPCSTRQVTDFTRPGGDDSQYATVQKMLHRLEAKGFVARDRRLSVHLFAATLDRDEFIDRRLRAGELGLWRLNGAALDPACSQQIAFGRRTGGPAPIIDRPDQPPETGDKSAARADFPKKKDERTGR